MVFVPHRKQTYGPPRPVTGIGFLLYLVLVRWRRSINPAIPSPDSSSGVQQSFTPTTYFVISVFRGIQVLWDSEDIWKAILANLGWLDRVQYSTNVEAGPRSDLDSNLPDPYQFILTIHSTFLDTDSFVTAPATEYKLIYRKLWLRSLVQQIVQLGRPNVGCWIPNKNEIRVTSKAGINRTEISNLDPCVGLRYRYVLEDKVYVILFTAMISIDYWY
jgi:hypothetical protein